MTSIYDLRRTDVMRWFSNSGSIWKGIVLCSDNFEEYFPEVVNTDRVWITISSRQFPKSTPIRLYGKCVGRICVGSAIEHLTSPAYQAVKLHASKVGVAWIKVQYEVRS